MPVTHVYRKYRRMGGIEASYANRALHESNKELTKEIKPQMAVQTSLWERFKLALKKKLKLVVPI